MNVVRRKSPRAPSLPLEEAVGRALAAYEKERIHPAPTEIVAQNLGYKSANSGSALAAIASLRYYGLLERPKEGMLAVSKAVESYKFTPDEAHRRGLLIDFLRNPPIFNELLQQYKNGLPSDATMRFELINRGFLPSAAEACIAVFRKSVEYVDYFQSPEPIESGGPESSEPMADGDAAEANSRVSVSNEDPQPSLAPRQLASVSQPAAAHALPSVLVSEGGDCIPIRLAGGRRAWLVVPEQMYEADKVRLKAQIDLLLTVEQEQALD